MSDHHDRQNPGDPADRDVDRGEIDPDAIRLRDSVGHGGDGDWPAETEESPIGVHGGHIAGGNTFVANAARPGRGRDLFPPE